MAGKIELSVDISVEWRRSATWGMCPTATVDALLAEDGVTVRRDGGVGHASGCGYDKRSAAVDKAMRELPLWQTFLMWRGFKHTYASVPYKGSDMTLYGLRRCAYGWEMDANACGMETIIDIFTANGFTMTSHSGDVYDFYHFERAVPRSFLKLI